jgi:hypothetical protein
LGGLARLLRMRIDTLHDNHYVDDEIGALAAKAASY